MSGAAIPVTVHRRRRRRWLIAALVVLAALLGAGYLGVAAMVGNGAPPLAFPPGPATPPTGDLDGAWAVAPGSLAGYRLGQTVMGLRGDVVARTSSVTGAVSIAGGTVTAATFDIDLATITANGKVQPGLADALGTSIEPRATIALTAPVALEGTFAGGAVQTTSGPATLSLHGTTGSVTVSFQARRNGDRIEVVGTVPVELRDWGVAVPAGAGFLGELDHHGLAEFLLVLTRAPG